MRERRDHLSMSQSQPLRIETPDLGSFGTARTINSLLWFVNNPRLEQQILAYLAKYQEKYGVILYAFALQGNHFHPVAKFPNCNRAAFYRDFNARVAEAVKRFVADYPGGPLFERRYTEQALPLDEDVEQKSFYCGLQAVASGLCSRQSDYPGYNSFHDAICGMDRKLSLVEWAEYNAAKRYNANIPIQKFTKEYKLRFSRLPGYEHLSQEDYKKLMLKKHENWRQYYLEKARKDENTQFLTKRELRAVSPGQRPWKTKKSAGEDRRPIVTSVYREAKAQHLCWYFTVWAQYKIASAQYLNGKEDVVFPAGTYKPPGPFVGPALPANR